MEKNLQHRPIDARYQQTGLHYMYEKFIVLAASDE